MPIPILLYTYLAAEILAPTLGAFVILNCILFLGKIIPLLDTLLGFGVSLADFLRLCSFIAPQLFLFTLPMSCMMGVIIGTTRLGIDSEIMILKASGIGLYKMLPPVLVIAFSAAALTGYFSIHLIPKANISLQKLMFRLAKEKIDKGLRERQFSDAIGNVVLYTDHIDKNTGEWQGVYVTDMRDRIHPIVIMARSGLMSADPGTMQLALTLKDGSLNRTMENITQHIEFEEYQLNLSLGSSAGMGGQKTDRRSLTLAQLQQRADQMGRHLASGVSLLIEFHQRLALPVGCLILTLLGFPLGLLAGPGQRSPGLGLGLGLFIAYYILITAAKALSESFILPVAPAMWGPNILFTLIMIFSLYSTARDTTAHYLEKGRSVMMKIPENVRNLIAGKS
jgi:lipopolysaccharide export system permease protein